MNESLQPAENKPTIIRRTLYMTGIWLALGVVAGALDPRFTGTIGTMVAIIAWCSMLTILAVFLGVAGGSYKESAWGAILGAAFAAIFAFIFGTGLDLAMHAIFGLLVGGMVGATCLPWLQTLLKTASLMLKGVQWMVRLE